MPQLLRVVPQLLRVRHLRQLVGSLVCLLLHQLMARQLLRVPQLLQVHRLLRVPQLLRVLQLRRVVLRVLQSSAHVTSSSVPLWLLLHRVQQVRVYQGRWPQVVPQWMGLSPLVCLE